MSSTDTNCLYLSATEILRLFRSTELSPVEFLDAMIDRAEVLTSSVNPFADTYFEEARQRARQSEKRYQSNSAGPLDGIPLAVKDTSAMAGTRATVGSLMNADRIDRHTDPIIERLQSAGANIFARTTCPEFCWLFTCHSRMWGITRNPWRLDCTPGGSSGGSAAALAAGVTTIATGSDSTGSIRQPAAQCGVLAFKAPYGRNPMSHRSSFDPYVHEGPMTRSVADAALMQNIMSGHHALDHNSLKDNITIPESLGDVSKLHIAYSMDLGHYHVVEDVERETLSALQALRDAGASVTEVDISWAREPIRLAHLNQEFVLAGALQEAIKTHGDKLSDYVPELLETALSATADDYRNSIRVAGQVWHQHLGPLYERYDALITPGVSCPEVPADGWQQTKLNVNGHQITDTDTAMTALFNMFNRCPVLSVPVGFTNTGLPVGIQIVTRPYDDVTAFHIGQAIETWRPVFDCDQNRPVIAAAL